MGIVAPNQRLACLIWLRSSSNQTFLDSEIADCPQRAEEMVSETRNPGTSISSNYLPFFISLFLTPGEEGEHFSPQSFL